MTAAVAPANSAFAAVREAFRPIVRLSAIGADLSDRLTDLDESTEYYCTSVRISAGGQVDQAILSRRLGWSGEDLDDEDTPPRIAGDRQQLIEGLGQRRCEIWVEDPEQPNKAPVPLFIGVLRERMVSLSDGEEEEAVATLEPDDFGGSVRGMRVWNPLLGEEDPPEGGLAMIERDWIFNPTRKRTDIIEGNMSSGRPTIDGETFSGLDDGEKPCLWLDPESVRTTVGDTLHSAVSPNIRWTLKDAVRTIQHELLTAFRADEQIQADEDATPPVEEGPLPNECMVKPALTDEELKPLTYAREDDLLSNVVIPIGTRLPDALDALCEPLGCGWRVDADHLGLGGNGDECQAVLRFFNVRTNPVQRILRLPNVGESVDDPVGTITKFETRISMAGATSRVRAVGEPIAREVTLELYRDWDAADDALEFDEMSTSQEGGLPDATAAVWRRWVANEAEDRNETRPEIKDGPDLAAALGSFSPRRVPLFQPLTQRDDTENRPMDYRLEWKRDEDADWVEAPEGWGWQVLHDECGIEFTGQIPPPELVNANEIIDEDLEEDPPVEAAAYPRLRITGTVYGDTLAEIVKGDPVNDDDEPIAASTYQRVERVDDRLKDRSRYLPPEGADLDDATKSYSRLTKAGVSSRDDNSSIEASVLNLSNRSAHGRSLHKITLSGIVAHYKVGEAVKAVRRRGMSMSVDAIGVYPCIDAITFDFAKQHTVLEFMA